MVIGALVASGWGSSDKVFALTPQEIYAVASPAVVFIAAFSEEGQKGGTGSIIRQDGLVLTNAHVVVDKSTGLPYPRLFAFLKPERVTGNQETDLARRVRVTVLAFDTDLDVALLKMEQPPSLIPVLAIGNSDRIDIGAHVLAIGHPEQGGLWTLTTGVISAEFENFKSVPGKHVFQTETSLNRGNSGGPLLDDMGRMIGVNTAIARLADDGMPITNINFSIKAQVAQRWLQDQHVVVAVETSPPSPPVAPPSNAVAPQVIAPPSNATAPRPLKPPASHDPAHQPRASVSHRSTAPQPYRLDTLLNTLRHTETAMDDLMQEMSRKTRGR